MKKRHFFFLLFVAQELGAKGSIAPSSPDDDKVDSSNKKKAALYMVRREAFAQWIFFYWDLVLRKTHSCLDSCFVSLQISDASGSMKVSMVAPASPFKQAMLSPEECYILDNGVDRTIFVWKGTSGTTAWRRFCYNLHRQANHQCKELKYWRVLTRARPVNALDMFKQQRWISW